MPTNEERRKVAQRLRECRGGWSSGECYYTIIHVLGLPDTSREDGAHALYAALADLIEPEPERTCRIVPMDAAGNPPYRKGHMILNEMSDGCSVCGYPFDTPNKGVPNYCSHCGAKVVGE